MASRRRLAIGALSVVTVAVVGAQLTGRGPVPEALEATPEETWATPTTVTRPSTTTTPVDDTTAPAADAEPTQADIDAFFNAMADAAASGPATEPSQSDIDAFLRALADTQSPTATTRDPDCHPNYGGCVPIDVDVDCEGGNGDGPSYAAGVFPVYGEDVYGLDPDGDLMACEPV